MEMLRVFTEDYQYLGNRSRETVHQEGLWHETFHCPIISQEEDGNYLHLQMRSQMKADYPGLFDIAVSGHLSCEEEITDGVREVAEELGLKICYSDLIPIDIMKLELRSENILDREFAHVYLYFVTSKQSKSYHIQKTELETVVKIPFEPFFQLWHGSSQVIQANCLFNQAVQSVSKENFLPYGESYMRTILAKLCLVLENHT